MSSLAIYGGINVPNDDKIKQGCGFNRFTG